MSHAQDETLRNAEKSNSWKAGELSRVSADIHVGDTELGSQVYQGRKTW